MANSGKSASGSPKSAGSAKKAEMPKFENKKSAASKSTASQSASSASRARAAQQAEAEKKEQSEQRIISVVLFAVALLLLAFTFVKGENVWLLLHNLMFQLFGLFAVAVPILLGYIGVVYTKFHTLRPAAGKLVGSTLFVLMADSLVHIFANMSKATESGEKYLSVTSVWQQLSDAWTAEKPLWTGGVFGSFAGGGLCNACGTTGALIICLIVAVAVVFIVAKIELDRVGRAIQKPIRKAGEIANEKIERSHEMREQRRAEKAEFNPPEQKKYSRKKSGEQAADHEDADDDTEGLITDETAFINREKQAEPAPEVKHSPKKEIEMPNLNQPADPPAEPPAVTKSDTPPVAIPTVPPQRKKKPAPAAEVKEEEKEDDTVFVPPQESLIPEIAGYSYPPLDCLTLREHTGLSDYSDEMNSTAHKLISTLDSFGVKAQVVNVCRGPSVTRYEIEPDIGVRINRITRLADDIALRLASNGVRISPIPNRSAIGIEVPNMVRETVGLREVIDSDGFRSASSKLNVALGKDIAGNMIFADLAKMPHLLIAGTTGSGKSVCLNTMIISILYNASPDEVKIVLIDPKQVEFTVYNGIGHLEVPVVANPRKAAGALGWAVSEMEKRYQQFSENNVRDIKGYNRLCESKLGMKKMHHVVIFIDELSDLMMVAPNEVEDSICRLAQMARAAGMHLVVATQRPSVNVITGVIKANIPSRIALSVSSQVDSRTILDASGAEKLLGNGDMLFAPIGVSKPQRLQGCFISDEEVENVVEFIKDNSAAEYNDDVMKEIESLAAATENPKKKGAADAEESSDNSLDASVVQALEAMIKAGKASTTFLQNKLGWGYPKAARVMGQIEEMGFIPPKEGNKERRVLITLQQLYELNASADGVTPSGLSHCAEGSAPAEDAFDDDFDEDVDFDDGQEDAQDGAAAEEGCQSQPFEDDDVFEEEPFTDFDDALAYDDAEKPDDDEFDDLPFDF